MADLEHYLENADEFQSLSDDDKARLFAGESIEGDTKPEENPSEEISEAPIADEETKEETPAEEAEAPEKAPVVMSKDGKHTIPFETLEDARNQAKEWERIAKENAALLEAMKKPEPQKEAPKAFDMEAKEREYMDLLIDGEADKALAVRKEINAEMQRLSDERASERATKVIEEREAKAAAKAEQAQLDAVVAEAIKLYPFLDDQSEGANNQAIRMVVALRNDYANQGKTQAEALALAVGEVAPMFQDKPKEAPKPVDAPAKAAEAIAKVKPKAPTSLSEVPAGSAAPHDEAAAMREMSGLSLMNKFAGKSPEQIMELMSRVI